MNNVIISPCTKYRYFLSSHISEQKKTLTFVMLNPSIANALEDDPTIKRCKGFCKSLGYGTLNVVNLFAHISPDPWELYKTDDPVGPENTEHLLKAAESSQMIICAWGTKGTINKQNENILNLLKGFDLHALKITKHKHPSHPLYLKAESTPILFREKAH